MVTFANPTTITRIRPSGVDQYGDPLPATELDVAGCGVWNRDANSTAPDEDTYQRDTVINGYGVLAPPGSDFRPTDKVRLRGVVYELVGEPVLLESPLTGTNAGVQLMLRHVEG